MDREKSESEIVRNYYIRLNISDIIAIDRPSGSLCIKEDKGNDYLAGVGPHEILESLRLSTIPGGTDLEVAQAKNAILKGFDPNMPLMAHLDYPLKDSVDFAIFPFEKKIGEHILRYYPSGYVAWCIAKQYEKIYQRPEEYGVWAHDINDLFLSSFTLIDSQHIEVSMNS